MNKQNFTQTEIIALRNLGIDENGIPACFYGMSTKDIKEGDRYYIWVENPDLFENDQKQIFTPEIKLTATYKNGIFVTDDHINYGSSIYKYEKIQIIQCPRCGTENPITRGTRRDKKTKTKIPIYFCENCGYKFTKPELYPRIPVPPRDLNEVIPNKLCNGCHDKFCLTRSYCTRFSMNKKG
jgi:predicted RNA-binding Zn-ribbon protein involved in translation (DUF1610 family)